MPALKDLKQLADLLQLDAAALSPRGAARGIRYERPGEVALLVNRSPFYSYALAQVAVTDVGG